MSIAQKVYGLYEVLTGDSIWQDFIDFLSAIADEEEFKAAELEKGYEEEYPDDFLEPGTYTFIFWDNSYFMLSVDTEGALFGDYGDK